MLGIFYFLCIDSYFDIGILVWGDFMVCIEEFIFVFNMGEEVFINSCFGIIYDSGGLEGDYGNGEEFVFIICLSDFMQCIVLDVVSFNIFFGD